MMDNRERRPRFVGGLVIGRRDASRTTFVLGVMIALIGVLLLLDHVDLIRIGSLLRFWPMILVCLGIANLFTPSSRVWGGILVTVGAVFQLNNLGILHAGIADLWPVAIIAVGVLLIWGAMKPPAVVSNGPADSSADTLNAVAVFGGCERRITTQNFRGGEATSIFGGVELDFRDANIEGDEATLNVHCIFGGVEIQVPTTWTVHSTSVPVLGGYADKTHNSPVTSPTAPKRKTLIISGAVIFGGVEISN